MSNTNYVNNSTEKKGDNRPSKSFFGTLNHPEKYLDVPEGATPQEIADFALDLLIDGKEDERAAMVSYCLAPTTGTPHLHYGLYSEKSMRLKAVRALMPHADNKTAKGTKAEIEDYVYKTGKHADKGEKVLAVAAHGNFQGREANTGVFEQMREFIFDYNLTPEAVCKINPKFYQHRQALEQMYQDKLGQDRPLKKSIHTTYHFGAPGSGKSYTQIQLKQKMGAGKVYVVTDYVHGFDLYRGEKTIFLDEMKDVSFADLLIWLDVYPNQVACRYANKYMLWENVHIASVLAPEELIADFAENKRMKETNDTAWGEFRRRIHDVCYHWQYEGAFYSVTLPMSEYKMQPWLRVDVERTQPRAVLAAAGCSQEEITALLAAINDSCDLGPEILLPVGCLNRSDAEFLTIIEDALFAGSYALTASILTVLSSRNREESSVGYSRNVILDMERETLRSALPKLTVIEAALLLEGFKYWNNVFGDMEADEQQEICQVLLENIVPGKAFRGNSESVPLGIKIREMFLKKYQSWASFTISDSIPFPNSPEDYRMTQEEFNHMMSLVSVE